MNKKEIIWCFRRLFSEFVGHLGWSRSIKKNLKQVIEENTALRLENDKLRERLGEVEKTSSAKSQHHGRENLQRIYNDGFHICTYSYGQRRENDEECMFCDELLFRE